MSSRAFEVLLTHLANILPLYKRIHPEKSNASSSCHRVRLYLCKPILQKFYNHPEKKATHRRHVIACVCIFVSPSCKYFTPIQTHPSRKKSNASSSCHRVRLYFCTPILQIFYPYTNASIQEKQQRIVMSSRAFVFL